MAKNDGLDSWGYGANPDGFATDSLGGVATSNPTVQWLMEELGNQFSEADVQAMIQDITRAVQNGIPLDKVPQICNIPPNMAAEVYDQIAATQGTSNAQISEKYEEQRQADMAAVQGAVMGSAGLGMFGSCIAPGSVAGITGLPQDMQAFIAQEGIALMDGDVAFDAPNSQNLTLTAALEMGAGTGLPNLAPQRGAGMDFV